LLLLLNNDVEAIAPGWLDAMVALAMQKDAGCIGAKLLYPNRTIQHAGVAVGVCGVGAHVYRGAPEANTGDFGRLALAHEVSAVTAACLLVRAAIYREVAGLDEVDLKIAFNDVDFCLKVRETGRRNLWTPQATLIHHESVSRGYEVTKEKYDRFQAEARVMARRWGDKLLADPFYSPNLSVSREDGSLRDATAPSAAEALLRSVTSAPEAA
jgi:GT2 family glycosyltransferase